MQLASIYKPVAFAALEDEMLLKRREIKFFFAASKLPLVHQLLAERFQVISFNGVLQQSYDSKYLDTPEFQHYLDHHNQRKNRYKIRFRHYTDAQLSFVELKHKTNSGFTIKNRIEIPYQVEELTPAVVDFLHVHYPQELTTLRPSIRTQYHRISLVTSDCNARITIDEDLSLQYESEIKNLPSLAVLELKYNQDFSYHYLRKQLKQIGIYPEQISKYCLGVCYLVPTIKSNNFKDKLRKIERFNLQQLCY